MIWSAEFRNTNKVSSKEFGDIRAAIAREKEVKHWDRKKSLALIAAKSDLERSGGIPLSEEA